MLNVRKLEQPCFQITDAGIKRAEWEGRSESHEAETMMADNMTKGNHVNIKKQSQSVEYYLNHEGAKSVFPLEESQERSVYCTKHY